MDETTQLSGIGLGPFEVVKWLAGTNRNRFEGIPGDRMPPISYWIQWVWSRLFGLSELPLRMLAVVVMALAAVIVTRAAARTWGGWAGLVAGLTFALSPNVIYAGAEIRAYPFLVVFAACAFWFLLRLNAEDGGGRTRTWAGLVLSCLGASYSHYFGLVLTGGIFIAVGWLALTREPMRRRLLVSAVVIVVCAGGLVPFVRSAADMSGGPRRPPGSMGHAALRLVYRCLGGHASWAVYRPVLVAGLLGATLALVVALSHRERTISPARLLALAVVSGLSVDLLARLVTSSFDSLQVTYNLWAVPAVVTIGASAVAAEGRWRRIAGCTGALLLLSANLCATVVLIQHGEAFAHSAGDRLNAEVARLGGPADLAVVHESSGPEWQFAFCPLRYVYGASLRQYLAEWRPDGTLTLHQEPGDTGVDEPPAIREHRLAVVHVEDIGAEGVVRFLRSHNAPKLSNDRLLQALEAQGWTVTKTETLMALGAEQVDWMVRSSP